MQEKILEMTAKLRKCATNEHCENMKCAYFLKPYELMELIDFVEKIMSVKIRHDMEKTNGVRIQHDNPPEPDVEYLEGMV